MITNEDGLADVASRPFDLVIVGGGPAALACAREYREAGRSGSVLMISADRWAPYNRPLLTKDYLRGEVGADTLPLAEDSWYAEHQITLALATTVSMLDRRGRKVHTDGGTIVDYRALVLATGSTPSRLPIDGADLPGVIYVRDRDSGEQLRRLRGATHRVAVIGSGFIGCETAASLARSGCRVTMVTDESSPHEQRLGADAGARIAGWLREENVELRSGCGASTISRRGEEWVVTLTDGSSITADGVVCGSGASPVVELAVQSGLPMRAGGVAVDASMRTTDPDVWAVGDIASAINDAAARPLRVEHWGDAETMGKIAGRVIAGEPVSWDQPPGFWSEIGDHTLKYAAWGDGFDVSRFAEMATGWAVLYGGDGAVVAVLASDWDDVYERGRQFLAAGTPFATAAEELFGPSAASA